MKTLHRPVWEGIQAAVDAIFSEGRPADKVIQFFLKQNKKWGSQDRRLFAECVYDLVRWWRKYLFLCEVDWPASDRWKETEPQILQQAIAIWAAREDVQLGRGVAKAGDGKDWRKAWEAGGRPRAVEQSIPNWLDRWGEEELGPRWAEVLPKLNQVAPVFLRTNILKVTAERLAEALQEEGFAVKVIDEETLRLLERKNVFTSKAFQAGWFEVQDIHSQKVARVVDPQPGDRIVDACAGAGGKSLHMASRMKNKGKIISLDVAENKLEQLRRRARRAGASIIEARFIESTKVVKRLSADRVLLDVPCSGLGVIRRNPDSKWKLTPAEVLRLQGLQQEILSRYSSMCRPGGRLVYSTCSIAPSENESQIEKFLKGREKEWKLLHQETLWPTVDGGDGFFIASFERRSAT